MGGVGGRQLGTLGCPPPRTTHPALTQDGAVGVHADRRVVGAQTAAGRGRGVRRAPGATGRGHPERGCWEGHPVGVHVPTPMSTCTCAPTRVCACPLCTCVAPHRGCPPLPGWHLPLGALQGGVVVEEPGQEPLELLHRRAPRGVQALPPEAAEVACGHGRAQHPGGTRWEPRQAPDGHHGRHPVDPQGTSQRAPNGDTVVRNRWTPWHPSRHPMHSQWHSMGTVVGIQWAPNGHPVGIQQAPTGT